MVQTGMKRRKRFPAFLRDQWADWRSFHAAKRNDLIRAMYAMDSFAQGSAWLGPDAYTKYKAAAKALKELRLAISVAALKETA